MWELLLIGMSVTVILMGCLVIRLYFSLGRRILRVNYTNHPEVWFAHGIAVAFIATVFNTAFFKFYLVMAVAGFYERTPPWVNNYINFVVVGLMIWAAFCHLYAAFLNLDETKRKEWTWLTIAFYPDRNPMVRLVHHVIGRNKTEKDDE